MAILLASNRRNVASASSAGHLVVNDHDWDVSVASNNDYVEIGELPANHALHLEGCSLYGLLNAGGKLAAQTMDVFVGNTGDESSATKIFAGAAFTADTAARVAPTAFVAAKLLGVSPLNRKIYLKLTTAPATAAGTIVARIASFPAG